MTVRCFPGEKRTRLPLLLGFRPSPAIRIPALTSCSLNLPISARSSFGGIFPLSEFFDAFTITITRIACSCRFKRSSRPGLAGNRLFCRGDEPDRRGSTPSATCHERHENSTAWQLVGIEGARHLRSLAGTPVRRNAGRRRGSPCLEACVVLCPRRRASGRQWGHGIGRGRLGMRPLNPERGVHRGAPAAVADPLRAGVHRGLSGADGRSLVLSRDRLSTGVEPTDGRGGNRG